MQSMRGDLCAGWRSSRHLSSHLEESFLGHIMSYMFDMRSWFGRQPRHPPFLIILFYSSKKQNIWAKVSRILSGFPDWMSSGIRLTSTTSLWKRLTRLKVRTFTVSTAKTWRQTPTEFSLAVPFFFLSTEWFRLLDAGVAKMKLLKSRCLELHTTLM